MGEEKRDSFDLKDKRVTRRTIVRSAAWSIPVVAFAATVPTAVASPGCTPTTISRTTAGQQTFVVPAGVTTVTFEVSGAPGGGAGGTAGPILGGAGGLVAGNLIVAQGDVVTLWAAEGGFYDTTTNNVLNAGGTGWAQGGSARDAGSGGGASAILVNSAPAVVAGGGGGGGSQHSGSLQAEEVVHTYLTYPYRSGGDAGAAGAAYPVGRTPSGTSLLDYKATALPGQGATTTSPGLGGGGGSWEGTNPATPPTVWLTVPGNPGNGSVGGAGVRVTGGNGTVARGSGGGGGGWFGGGSGSAVRYFINTINRLAFGSGGGGGSSWTDPTRATTISEGPGVPPSESASRVPGYVTISYCTPSL